MKNRKLIALLKVLNKTELKAFTQFVIADKGTDSKEHLLLLYLLEFWPGFEDPHLTVENAFRIGFPDKIRFIKKDIDNKLSDLTGMVKTFLAFRELESQPADLAYWTALALRRKKASDLFYKQLRELRALTEKSEVKDKSYYFKRLQERYLQYHYADTNRRKNIKSEQIFSELADNLDRFFILFKMEHAVEAQHRSIILSEHLELDFVGPVMEKAGSEAFRDNPLFGFFKMFYQGLTSRHPEAFGFIKNNSSDYLKLLPQSERWRLLSLLINYCIHQYQKGHIQFLRKALDFSQLAVELNYYEGGKTISPTNFTNIVILGASMPQEWEWTESFIQSASQYLPADRKENTLKISRAYLDFEKGRFKEAYHMLSSLHYHGMSEKLQGKCLEVRSLYEIHASGKPLPIMEDLSERLNTYKVFIMQNKQFSKVVKEANLNFVKVLLRLHRTGKTTRQKKEKLLKAIQSAPYLICRTWLKRKVGEMPETGRLTG